MSPQEVSIGSRERGGFQRVCTPMVKPGGHTEATAFACPWVSGDLACLRRGSESGMTHEEDRLVLRHSGSSNGGRGQPGHEGILVVQEQKLLCTFASTSRTKSRGNAVFQGFAIIIWPLMCCFLTPGDPAPVEHGLPRVSRMESAGSVILMLSAEHLSSRCIR